MEEKIADKKLTAQEILELYPRKFSLSTLHRLAKDGELKPCGRIGKKTRVWKQSSIENYLERDLAIQE
jgi:predicted DNA-binding transcriptional regulator AlpA